MTHPLPDWSDLPDDLRLRVQQQTPERQALWAELRASADSPAEFLYLLSNRLDKEDILAAVASALCAAFASEWGPPHWCGAPPHRLSMGPVQEIQTTSACVPKRLLSANNWCWRS